MKLNELLKLITDNPKTLYVESTGDVDSDKMICRRLIFAKTETIADSMAIWIIIKNKGTKDEAAYFKGDMPEYLKEKPFTNAVKSELKNSQTVKREFDSFKLVAVDEDSETAEFVAYKHDNVNKTTSQIRYVATKNIDGTIKISQLS